MNFMNITFTTLMIVLITKNIHPSPEYLSNIIEESINKFISDSRSGVLEEAEDDAVCIRGLRFSQEKLLEQKKRME